ncbi:MAG: hypothetical protein ABDH32_00950 [Candidatus Caldarchaeales archaeon]
MKSRLSILLLLLILSLGVLSNTTRADVKDYLNDNPTITETVYTYTGAPITLTTTKIVREYITMVETITEFSTLFKTDTLLLLRTTTIISTSIVTMTVYSYLPVEAYSAILGIMLATLIVLLLILSRLSKARPKEIGNNGAD